MAERLAVDVAGAAQLLGVSPGLVRKLTLLDEIPHAKVGARVVYPIRELTLWLSERTKNNDHELEPLVVVKEGDGGRRRRTE